MAIGSEQPFKTNEIDVQATHGVTTNITPNATATITMFENTTSVIIYNRDTTNALFVFALNTDTVGAGINIAECLELATGAYITLSLGTNSERAGTDRIQFLTTAAASFKIKVTQICSSET